MGEERVQMGGEGGMHICGDGSVGMVGTNKWRCRGGVVEKSARRGVEMGGWRYAGDG